MGIAEALSQPDVAVLLKLLGPGSANKKFQSLAASFKSSFGFKEFQAACVIMILLGEQFSYANQGRPEPAAGGLLLPPGRLAAIYILFQVHATVPMVHKPFLPFFLELLTKHPSSQKNNTASRINSTPQRGPPSGDQLARGEAEFIVSLLWQQGDFKNLTPAQYIKQFNKKDGTQTTWPDLAPVKKLCSELQGTIPQLLFRCLGVRGFVSEHRSPYNDDEKESSFSGTPPMDLDQAELKLHCAEPEFLRPAPPMLEIDDAGWIHSCGAGSGDIHEGPGLVWRPIEFTSTKEGKEDGLLRELLELAGRTSLSIQQEDHILGELQGNKRLPPAQPHVLEAIIGPTSLPFLVRHNPKVATQVLLGLKGSSRATEYWKALVNMDLSCHQLGVHSMEVVNRLANDGHIPKPKLHRYISNCIRSCEAISDPFFQTRLVRLVCVFLQTLIRNKVIQLEDLFVEIQTFCIQFSRCKEVSALFRLIKSHERHQVGRN